MEVIGDSLLILNQLAGEYECRDDLLKVYYEDCQLLLKDVKFKHVPREQKPEANNLAQLASGYQIDKMSQQVTDMIMKIGGRKLLII